MGSSLFLLLGLGGRLDAKTIHEMVVRSNEKRRKIFTRLADLLFGLFMLIFGQLKLTGPDGKALDLGNPSALEPEEKLNAILLAQERTQRGLLFRELLRPAIVSIAELLATLMEPDEQLLAMLATNSPAAASSNPPALPASSPVYSTSPAAAPAPTQPAAARPRGGNL